MTKQELINMLANTDSLLISKELENLGIIPWERDFIFVWKDIHELYESLVDWRDYEPV